MSRQWAKAMALSLIVFALCTDKVASQTYFWLDDVGAEQESLDFSKVPSNKILQVRCVVRVTGIVSGEELQVQGGHRVRLIGVDSPWGDLSWRPNDNEIAMKRLSSLIGDEDIEMKFDRNFKDADHKTLVYAWTKSGRFLNQTLLAEGLATPLFTDINNRHADDLKGAAKKAKADKVGLWASWQKKETRASPTNKIQGFSLGLYSRDPDFDYQPFLRELREIGATNVLLITPWFLDHFSSCKMVPKQHRSTPLPQIGKVIRQAKSLGLRVAIMPIVLLWQPDDDHWRGNIEPRDAHDWFLAYQEFIGAFASLAQNAGADELLVGSEFSSLEKDEKHWREVIRGVRHRFSGTLSYSANWDHLEIIKWWDALDTIGMTGYHSLTKKLDPTPAELYEAWSRIRKDLEVILSRTKKPYFFSEMGYASLDGINKDPWDYVSPEEIDWQEQADCYEAWFSAWKDAHPRFRGAFFYTWWRNNDEEDKRQYTIHGKPAEAVIRKWYKK